jgi:hypothetical protein
MRPDRGGKVAPIDESLSDDAKAIAGTVFLITGSLEYQTPSRIPERAKAALDELVEAKIAVREPMPGGGIRYRRRVPDVDMRGYARWFNRNKHVGDGLMLMGPG